MKQLLVKLLYVGLFCSSLLADEQAIELQPHQTYVVDYLKENPSIKGILVDHYMGTGKTYLAIGAVEAFPEHEIVVVAPRFIEGHWREHIKKYGVKNPNRYTFLSYHDAPKTLLKRDLSRTLVILDEVHNLVRFLRSPLPDEARRYSELYLKLQTAHRIIGLSGTPIYDDLIDIAYLINLVSAKNLLPFNEEEFRIQYTEIDRWKSFWRGYVTESQITSYFFMSTGVMLISALVASPWVIAFSPLLIFTFPLVNKLTPINPYTFREMQVDRLKDITQQYISYYEVSALDSTDYPSETFTVRNVAYNEQQYDYFLKYASNNLNNEELEKIVSDYVISDDSATLALNSTIIQKFIQNYPGNGREIGNMSFPNEQGQLVESPKFEEIYDVMRQDNFPSTVIYSSYNQNGIRLFAEFLDRKGMQGAYAKLLPTMSSAEITSIVDNYNNGKTKILLLHPEIMEGVSLKGTRQMHILEPVLNNTGLRQVKARVIRYLSHTHLPEDQRHVDTYMWKIEFSKGLTAYLQRKKDWWKRHSELSDWSQFGDGLRQVDKYFDRKVKSPDELVYMKLQYLDTSVNSLNNLLRKYSIESGKK